MTSTLRRRRNTVLRKWRRLIATKTDELYELLLSKGYPQPFCQEIAYHTLNTDFTATRMIGYLYRVSEPSLEMVVDEMLAIVSDRDRLIRKKETERAQAVINDVYTNGL